MENRTVSLKKSAIHTRAIFTHAKLVRLFVLFVVCACSAKAQVPQWAKGVVWYQIFPERFSNGDTANGPFADKVLPSRVSHEGWALTPWGSNWFAQSDWEKNLPGSFRDKLGYRRYGGDIQGIINKLDYIKSLGVGAIYLNPVFDAVSLHKYDGSTYHHIDINFGPDPEGDRKLIETETPDNPATWVWTKADKLFLELIRQAHARNIKVVIDGVFNHTGVQFWAFQDIVKKGKNSKFVDWYQIKSWGDSTAEGFSFDYKGWWNFKGLPEFNRTKENLHPSVKQYIINATKKWMDPNNDGNPDDGIDGWRLDVAREVPIGFWRDWKAVVKGTNRDAIIIGELWELSPDFVDRNGVFDGLMNYNFAYAVADYFVNNTSMTSSAFIARLKEIDMTYPEENLYVLQNLMSSHDTERLISMIANPGRQYDRNGDERNKDYNPGKPKQEYYEMQKLIAAFQYLYRGAPMIYYGDESGMWGADDPHCRKPMVWDELQYDDEIITSASGFTAGLGKYKVNADRGMLGMYRRLGSMRQFSPALRTGKIDFIINEDNSRAFGFYRTQGTEKVVAYFNAGKSSEVVEIPVTANEVIDMTTGEHIKISGGLLRFAVWGNSFAVYRIAE
ncbi:MAG: glycoside hydrolase family 13 protein [Ignavibacteria bacterium]|nr:glycoside hydrolase family 13 protein [Ignavibacteria bacterium]